MDLDRRAVGLGDLSIGAEIDASFQCAVRTRSTKQAIALNEAETRAEHIDPALAAAGWGVVDGGRSKLLDSLADAGFGAAQLAEMQRAIDAENSDLFDVQAYVAWESPPLTRTDRAEAARVQIHSTFNEKQQAFLDFVLAHYVSEGVSELDQKKLSPLLRLRYNDSIPDAIADLGRPDEIGRVFAGFQKFLYQGGA